MMLRIDMIRGENDVGAKLKTGQKPGKMGPMNTRKSTIFTPNRENIGFSGG